MNAPLQWPKSSLSSNASGSAAQFWATNRCPAYCSGLVDRTRHQLLAGAALTENQHVDVGDRELLDGPEQTPHLPRRPDQSCEAAALPATAGRAARQREGVAVTQESGEIAEHGVREPDLRCTERPRPHAGRDPQRQRAVDALGEEHHLG